LIPEPDEGAAGTGRAFQAIEKPWFFDGSRYGGNLHAASASVGCADCRFFCMKRVKTTVHAAGFDGLFG